jgi:excisionase family DNA binding protein
VTYRLRPLVTSESNQLTLEVSNVTGRRSSKNELRSTARGLPRLCVSPDEAAEMLGVSRDYFDEHVVQDLRIVRRGRRILIPLSELDRWLERNAARSTVARRA